MPNHRFDDVGNVEQVYDAGGDPLHSTPERRGFARRLVATILATPDFSPTVWQKLLE